jgi:hypothetical protein
MGYRPFVDKEVTVARVDVTETRNGNRRFVLHDTDGEQYTTFRPQIGTSATKYDGRRARISYHEEERNGFTNVYLDAIEPADEPDSGSAGQEPDSGSTGREHEAEEAAWQTAVEAAPWLSGQSEPEQAVEPDELFDRLKPFQQRVADDIRDEHDGSP